MLAYFTIGQARQRVEVCMTYAGRQNCARASATSRQQALRTASENACAIIASGMTDSMACSASQPVSVKWLTD
jgi:hypothetical protein